MASTAMESAAEPSTTTATPSVGCEHYQRKCLLKAPCCGKLYVCRLCHDAEEHHQMDRFRVTEVECVECHALQPVQQTCQQCGAEFGVYYCDVCHLFDKDRKQYHCEPCGICRIGPQEGFFHCETCNLCLPVHLRDGNHKCVRNVSRQNCAVCLEDMHSSRINSTPLPCGHLLHTTCLADMRGSGAYRCPLCLHTTLPPEGTRLLTEQMDAEIAQTPMPAEYRGATVQVMCNDCLARSTSPFHVLGLKCAGCGSYNTAQDGGLILQQQEQIQGDNEPGPDGDMDTDTDTE